MPRARNLLLTLSLVLLGTGCLQVGTETSSPAEETSATFRSRGERIFRLQNQALDRFIEVGDDEVPRSDSERLALATAEDDLVSSCRDLNEAAGLQGEGRVIGRLLQLKILGSLQACEDKALAAHKLTDPDPP